MYYEKKKDVLWTLELHQVLKHFILTLDENNKKHKQNWPFRETTQQPLDLEDLSVAFLNTLKFC